MKTMCMTVAVCAAVAGMAACTPPAEQDTAIEQVEETSPREASLEMGRRWDAAFVAGNVDETVALYLPDGSVSPPAAPTASGTEALRTFFGELFADGGIDVENSFAEVLDDGELVASYGTYVISEDGAPVESGSWSSASRFDDSGGLMIAHNIWNRDAPAEGRPAPPPLAEIGPAPAADAPCAATPTALDQAFEAALESQNAAVVVALHTEDGVRMPPGMPAVKGHADLARYVASRIEPYKKQVLDLTDIRETAGETLGWTSGKYSFDYTPKKKGPSAKGAGTYMAVSTKGGDGCWRLRWVLWNSDAPPAS